MVSPAYCMVVMCASTELTMSVSPQTSVAQGGDPTGTGEGELCGLRGTYPP